MDFERYETAADAQQKVKYRIYELRVEAPFERGPMVRWKDSATDMFFQTHVGWTVGAKGGTIPYELRSWVMLVQGQGSRCQMDNSGAPSKQRGEFALSDGRKAVWAIGVRENRWDPAGPVWLAWNGRDGIVRRVEGTNVPIQQVIRAAEAVAAQEQ